MLNMFIFSHLALEICWVESHPLLIGRALSLPSRLPCYVFYNPNVNKLS